MSEKIGAVVLEDKRLRYLGDQQRDLVPRDFSEDTAREADLEVRQLVLEALERATAILRQRRAQLDAGAKLLLAKESVTPDDFPPLRGDFGGNEAAQITKMTHA